MKTAGKNTATRAKKGAGKTSAKAVAAKAVAGKAIPAKPKTKPALTDKQMRAMLKEILEENKRTFEALAKL
ncbi:hypothetical protein [Meiothermus granaticius]|uniref:Uncharacterized protein n=1 Tax=Meiothermus granaticius NBRC 107808 TaxID=1227551 RepID=A0A399F9A7_9DEIN|nr:hypothetical protein [Meiothermus granaticius]RIH92683.1 hypothetical protein Mgrana_01345 [Meiothermus granaticius NBRC 107808]GEM87734.1 hypothetical protein MGR01S_23590 [Meiothermus granaticius NBRC 107808]